MGDAQTIFLAVHSMQISEATALSDHLRYQPAYLYLCQHYFFSVTICGILRLRQQIDAHGCING